MRVGAWQRQMECGDDVSAKSALIERSTDSFLDETGIDIDGMLSISHPSFCGASVGCNNGGAGIRNC